ncbi:uncharacterized protein FOBCDRAFT_277156 [Fusarium oxysporum Fo47]|uniref:DUF1593 domain-containing protein n=1 Tax=Fusarium oxysporum Fo47 TaxID=660027 RepID=W9JH60_FUSOX|nr:uncharacterized protein FOBCDRAFT_277156 [Fusarium oxysporum Fo47]EWZ29015.1 hypothetical protein FOZG_17308 [Fusarium oxysporum Fo47]QKD57513.1 hypothetical protein FOBCDRAFT_277156 [Fusarium oxysporum Fo47]
MAAARGANALAQEPAIYRPRVFMMSDILNEPDDEMSLVRFLLYSNHFDVRGICATTSISLQNETHPEAMERIIRAYAKVVDNLNTHVGPNCQYPDPDKLLALVSSGPKVYGRKFLDEPLSEGAKRLVQALDESEEPLYCAQALHHIEQTKPKEEGARLRSRLRVYAISDQDDAGLWIRIHWPNIFYIVSVHGFGEFLAATWVGINESDNGMPDMTKVKDDWLTPNIRLGPLGAEYPYITFGMEGDSPSFMWLIPNGLSNPERPEWGGWGGRYNRVTWSHDLSGEYGVSPDTVITKEGKPYMSVQSTIWRWRDASQDDFASRMQWTLHQDFSATAHPPILNINGSAGPELLQIEFAPEESVILDASKTIDVDHPDDLSQLEFEWYYYLEPGFPHSTGKPFGDNVPIKPLSPPEGTDGILAVNEAGFSNVVLGPKVSVTNMIPPTSKKDQLEGEWHVILQVRTKKGPYHIRRYKRVVFKYVAAEA